MFIPGRSGPTNLEVDVGSLQRFHLPCPSAWHNRTNKESKRRATAVQLSSALLPGRVSPLVNGSTPAWRSWLSSTSTRTMRAGCGSCCRRSTPMPVHEATHGLSVRPNHVYVIPPNMNLALARGVLMLTPRQAGKGLHLPIDYLFRSLAEDQQGRAIAVVLSETGSDGTQGLCEIKALGTRRLSGRMCQQESANRLRRRDQSTVARSLGRPWPCVGSAFGLSGVETAAYQLPPSLATFRQRAEALASLRNPTK